MKDSINYTGYLRDFIENELKPRLLSVGWVDLGTQTVSGITFKGLKNTLNQGFFYDVSNPNNWFCYWPTGRTIVNDFVPPQTQLKWNIVGSKIPVSNSNTNNPSLSNRAYDIFYNDKSWIVIDKTPKTTDDYTYFYNTAYRNVAYFISLNENLFFTGNETQAVNTIFRLSPNLNKFITYYNGTYYFNEDFNNNTSRTPLNIPKEFHKTGYFTAHTIIFNNTYANITYPYVFVYNECFLFKDFVISVINFNSNFSLSNFDFYMISNYTEPCNQYYIGINREIY